MFWAQANSIKIAALCHIIIAVWHIKLLRFSPTIAVGFGGSTAVSS